MANDNPLLNALNSVSLTVQIATGLVLGIPVGAVVPQVDINAGLLGSLFVGAPKAIAPVLVFVLVTAAIARHQKGDQTCIKPILILCTFGTFAATVMAVVANVVFPTTLILRTAGDVSITPSSGIIEVLKTLLMSLVINPINVLANANYIDVLAWALILGAALHHHGPDTTRQVAADLTGTVSTVVKWIIRFAPLDIFDLVFSTIAETGFEALAGYMQLLAVLLGCMLFIALVVNPIIVWTQIHSSPFPLVFTYLRESGAYAFFTRSSATNVPMNMASAEKLGLHKDTYSISISLGATINMADVVITITILTMAAAHTRGITADLATALLLSLMATVSACGASGIADGSLLLIPLAYSLSDIDNDVAMQVVAVGFIIGMIQDSAETALNPSTDVLSTATADLSRQRKE